MPPAGPTPTTAPTLLIHSPEVLADLGLDPEVATTEEFLRVFSGNATLDAMDPYAMAYGGHQFGNWAGQLGDGRAIGLGEIVTADGKVKMEIEQWRAKVCQHAPKPRRAPLAAPARASSQSSGSSRSINATGERSIWDRTLRCTSRIGVGQAPKEP